MAEIKEAITRPEPIPMRRDAINSRAEFLRNMNPTPRPIRVVPEMIHVLLSFFEFILMFFTFPLMETPVGYEIPQIVLIHFGNPRYHGKVYQCKMWSVVIPIIVPWLSLKILLP